MLNDVVFSPDSKQLVTLGDDKLARIWNVGDYSKDPCELKVKSGNFLTASFSHDRTRLVAVIHDDPSWNAEVWNIAGATARTNLSRRSIR